MMKGARRGDLSVKGAPAVGRGVRIDGGAGGSGEREPCPQLLQTFFEFFLFADQSFAAFSLGLKVEAEDASLRAQRTKQKRIRIIIMFDALRSAMS